MSQVASLQRILQIAATTPGNWKRFQAAGLLSADTGNGAILLAEDWQERFLHLPVVDKGTIRQNPGQFLASVDDIVYRGTTSGTEGRHFVYFADSQWDRMRLQARRRSLAWWGIDDTIPIINVSSRLFPVRPCDLAIAGKPSWELVDRLLAQLSMGPAVIRGYPTRLCDIATAVAGKKLPFTIAVIATGELLFDFQKDLLERVFGAPVINEYGCQESGISGLSCPEFGRLHLDSDRCFYESIDDRVVTTDLFNQVMPMVRYQCGDALTLHPEPCPCGRPGPTAILLGRVDDWVPAQGRKRYVGEVEMPPIPGISTYQAICSANQITLHVVPEVPDQSLNLQPLMGWAAASFGHRTTQVTIREATLAPAPGWQTCEPSAWINAITQGSWETWHPQARMPQGELEATAQLLYQLSHPGILSINRLPLSTWTQLQTVLQQPSSQDGAIAQITARILLFACSFMAQDPSVHQIYQNAIRRLTGSVPSSAADPPIHTLDTLIPTLFLPTSTGLEIWQNWLHTMDHDPIRPVSRWSVDTLTIQHLLHAFEPAVQHAYQRSHPMLPALRPLVSVLLGDLTFFAAQLGPWLLAYWFELLHQQSLPPSPWLQAPDDFARTWLTWRQQLQSDPQNASFASLQQWQEYRSEKTALTPEHHERIHLERGYGLLVQQKALEPGEWLPLLQTLQQPQGLSHHEIDPTPWHPILKALVKPLFTQGHYDLAYACLVAFKPPNSRFSAFERLASENNYKQPVLLRRSIAEHSMLQPDNSDLSVQ
ncbi:MULTISPECIES: hypothetical protein [unclassified Leptolyngbya]|uniref:hypothetical protein n=1 Tax=unclassified Leptolyngbya TaxID=2650499 RepID=UPI0016828197|nr:MULTISPECIES: hypothetical protein [unclassified Leptolyngbya]MBD1909055.1 hypothetical protein [Leptolyngbya sp. FACHB-8]MBD2157436.1 hypothetical protein [Leptolyngbya sp. FACHB-16]